MGAWSSMQAGIAAMGAAASARELQKMNRRVESARYPKPAGYLEGIRLEGRDTAGEPLPLYVRGCVTCGALVFDTRAHTAWHKGTTR